ncbi:MAG: hypothetical protein LUD77_03205 [Clostridiales bacterium]|nr:hypothetical protein [Clostridiales bacterium]
MLSTLMPAILVGLSACGSTREHVELNADGNPESISFMVSTIIRPENGQQELCDQYEKKHRHKAYNRTAGTQPVL